MLYEVGADVQETSGPFNKMRRNSRGRSYTNVYPQHITRPSKTQEARPYWNNPYEIAPPPPLPSTPIIIERKSGKGRWVAEFIVLGLLMGIGLASVYVTSNYWYGQGYNNGHADGQKSGRAASGQGYNNGYSAGKIDGYTTGYNDGYAAGKKHGYKTGYADGKRDGHNSGYAKGLSDGELQELSDLYDFIATGNGGTPAKPCMHTSDQPDYVYFKMIKDNSGTITYECLV